jgi:hypothetical protein
MPRPDLLILDTGLSRVGGWQVLKTLRTTPALARMPVVMLTGVMMDRDKVQRPAPACSSSVTTARFLLCHFFYGLSHGTLRWARLRHDSDQDCVSGCAGQLQVFRYPHPTGTVSIPTALMYRTAEGQQSTTTPSLSFYISEGEDIGTPAYEHFKVLLPLVSRAQWYAHGWPEDRSPQEVTRLYFRHLLMENLRSFMPEIGSIDRVVVAIPNAWFEPSGRSGRQILRRMFLQDLGLTDVQFHSDATCAVAYIAHCYQQKHHQAPTGTILVCDMGGGRFQVALCRLQGKHIEMLAHDGDGEYGLGLAGVAFDRAAARRRLTWNGAPKVRPGPSSRFLRRRSPAWNRVCNKLWPKPTGWKTSVA